ncbi:hypothetical protein NE562_17505 [Butyricicoccus faecihominis]|uniref:hypothetical protein n=1 Tax=Butyricicoccus faecihominis TaxID=1712515 RepID=UPI002479B691|nr:hypothetical protein [Butyricicoccus faecihominis]MCQ5131451.1 hypothetical protein [Butyricicoccus faecihominis]
MNMLIVAAGFVFALAFLGYRLLQLGRFLDHSTLHPYPCDTIHCENAQNKR